MRTVLRRTALIVAGVVAVLLVPAVGATISTFATFNAVNAPGPDRPVPAAPPVVHDPAKPTAVVVVGDRGAVVSDVLAPYDVLASTGRFNVYTVASQRRPLPLTGGLDLVPDLTFDELAARAGVPDLVVVPALPDVGEPTTAPVTTWLRAQAAADATLLSVCNGSGVLASAGLLDGRPATAHWNRIGRFEQRYPAVDWVPGRRFVDDGDVVTTAGILSGVDGALHMVERFAGPAAAADAAAVVGWHRPADSPVTPATGMPDAVAIVNSAFRWSPARIGVLLSEGVGEMELASVFDAHGGQSLAARTLALSGDGGPVRSSHGLTFLPRADVASAGASLDRLVVPGAHVADVARPSGGPAPEYLHREPGFVYDLSLADLARTTDVATARWTAKVLELPTPAITLAGPAWPWGPTALPLVLVLLGGAAVAAAARWRRLTRAQASAVPMPGKPHSGRLAP